MIERKVQHTWGASLSYADFKKLVDEFEAERFGDDAIIEFVNVSYRPGGETGAAQTTMTLISRKST